MSTGDTTRFDVLMDLAEKIAEKSKDKTMAILRKPGPKWIVVLHTLRDTELDNPLPTTGYKDTLEEALEVFVTSPRK